MLPKILFANQRSGDMQNALKKLIKKISRIASK